jgi:hypothetical protein
MPKKRSTIRIYAKEKINNTDLCQRKDQQYGSMPKKRTTKTKQKTQKISSELLCTKLSSSGMSTPCSE